MKIGLAQLNTTVGDLRGNAEKILAAYRALVARGAHLVLTPELALTGYPPQDLVFKSRFVPLNLEKLDELHQAVGDVPLIVGFIDVNSGPGQPFHNAAAVLQRGQPIRKIHKSLLPTYDVFDEDRYFEPAKSVEPVEIAGTRFGVTICEDIWTEKYLPRHLYGSSPVGSLIAQGIQAILNLSASPFSLGKAARRAEMLSAVAREHRLPIHYCNAIGGNDQLVFDGNSLALDSQGTLHTRLAPFAEECAIVDLHPASPSPSPAFPSEPEELFHALSLGTRDYLHKCGFHSAVLGLSGGIDSAVTACLAAQALGAEHVLGVTMPTQFSSPGSIDDSLLIAQNLGIRCLTIPIQRSFEVFREQFREIFAGLPEDTTEENMQPRLRGMTLMALSNKFGSLLLTTGNKSELAVGYCTLYGDMCGGLAVISDVPKTMVYELAEWINRDREIIPRATIEKPPSAELKPDQRDQDTLPPYEILDPILQLYVEEQLSSTEIIARGFDEKTVRWVVRRVDLNEYKRAQAVPGLKVTGRAFGLGRKMPVAQRFVE
ncbi:MAG: NAD+ synthase [Chthoniobacter sp.]|uniref:NAD+ synthase n=1 Tax=Chthoniobacter sp. TaxID=2510640 RepID=UPI0032A2A1A2